MGGNEFLRLYGQLNPDHSNFWTFQVISNGDSLISNLRTIYNIPVFNEVSSLAPLPTHSSRPPDFSRRDDYDDRSSRKRPSPDTAYDSYYNDRYDHSDRSRDYYWTFIKLPLVVKYRLILAL